MPRGASTFIRTNGQFTGSEIWQDDLEAQKKIIALRHDTHDEDIAKGIAECLPKDGSEPMLNNFDLGGFISLNSGQAGTGELLQVPNYGQIVTSMSFDEPTRTLTLVREGMANMAVTIQSGGDGIIIQQGIQQIFAGVGIQFENGNEMSEGNPIDTISITDIAGVQGSYVLPSLSVDAQGRIVVINDGSADIDLSAVPGTTNVSIDISGGGTSALILDATLSRAGVMTASQVADLENAAAGTGTNLTIGSRTNSVLELESSTGANVNIPRATGGLAGIITGNEYTDLLNASGDPDQSLSYEQTSNIINNITLTKQGVDDVISLLVATPTLAGLMSGDFVKQISGLTVDGGGITKPMSFINETFTVEISDHTDTIMALTNWKANEAGIFSGTITNVPPVNVGSTPEGHMWLVYD